MADPKRKRLASLKSWALKEISQIGAVQFVAPGAEPAANARREEAELARAHERTLREIQELQRTHEELMRGSQAGVDAHSRAEAEANQARMQELLSERNQLELRKVELDAANDEMRRREAQLEEITREHERALHEERIAQEEDRRREQDMRRHLDTDRLRELDRLRRQTERPGAHRDPYTARFAQSPLDLPTRGRTMPFSARDPLLSRPVASQDPYFDPYNSLAAPPRERPMHVPQPVVRPDDPYNSVLSRDSLARHTTHPFGYHRAGDPEPMGKASWPLPGSRKPPPAMRNVAGLRVPVENPHIRHAPQVHLAANVEARRAAECDRFGTPLNQEDVRCNRALAHAVQIDRLRENDVFRRQHDPLATRHGLDPRLDPVLDPLDPRIRRAASTSGLPLRQPPLRGEPFARQSQGDRVRTSSDASQPFSSSPSGSHIDPRSVFSASTPGGSAARRSPLDSRGPNRRPSMSFMNTAQTPASQGGQAPPTPNVFSELAPEDIALLSADPTVRELMLSRLTPIERDRLMKRLETAEAQTLRTNASAPRTPGPSHVRFASRELSPGAHFATTPDRPASALSGLSSHGQHPPVAAHRTPLTAGFANPQTTPRARSAAPESSWGSSSSTLHPPAASWTARSPQQSQSAASWTARAVPAPTRASHDIAPPPESNEGWGAAPASIRQTPRSAAGATPRSALLSNIGTPRTAALAPVATPRSAFGQTPRSNGMHTPRTGFEGTPRSMAAGTPLAQPMDDAWGANGDGGGGSTEWGGGGSATTPAQSQSHFPASDETAWGSSNAQTNSSRNEVPADANDGWGTPQEAVRPPPSTRSTLGTDFPAFDDNAAPAGTPRPLFPEPAAPPPRAATRPPPQTDGELTVVKRGEQPPRPVIQFIEHIVRMPDQPGLHPNLNVRDRLGHQIASVMAAATAKGANAVVDFTVQPIDQQSFLVEGDAVVLG